MQAPEPFIKDPKTVFISTYGCQMNVNDTERMYSLLEMSNYFPVTTPEEASLIIINSCSVREKPVHKVASEVGRYRKLKADNPHLRIGVSGCVAQQEKDRLLKQMPLLDFVLGTDAIDDLPRVVGELDQGMDTVVSARFRHQDPYATTTLIRNPKVTAFVNIMKGCDNFCTFCVVPFTRGREKSRNLDEVIRDIQALEARGIKEVTLIGQNVNSYQSDDGRDFADLVDELAKKTNLLRIRYTTPHPKDFNLKLVNVMQSHRPRVCEYLHLPAQSGNSEILARMNRGYTRAEYLEKARMIRSVMPDVVFSTDLIVGFPGETDADFEDTMTLLDEVEFENIYAFKYSPRPFTKAARFEDQVPEEVKSERLERLQQKHRAQGNEFAKRYLSRTVDVLVEEHAVKHGKFFGRTSQNKLVYFDSPQDLTDGKPAALDGQVVRVKINKANPQTLYGERLI